MQVSMFYHLKIRCCVKTVHMLIVINQFKTLHVDTYFRLWEKDSLLSNKHTFNFFKQALHLSTLTFISITKLQLLPLHYEPVFF